MTSSVASISISFSMSVGVMMPTCHDNTGQQARFISMSVWLMTMPL